MDTAEEEILYAVDPDWFEQNGMSLSNVLAKRLCPSCQKKLANDSKANPDRLIGTISKCCSQDKDFIHPQQPVVESLFRLFISEGNKPLLAEELMENLNQRRGESPVSISAETLARLLGKTRYLGMGPVGNK